MLPVAHIDVDDIVMFACVIYVQDTRNCDIFMVHGINTFTLCLMMIMFSSLLKLYA